MMFCCSAVYNSPYAIGNGLAPNAVKVEVLPASEDPDAAALLDSELGSLADGGRQQE